MEHQEIKKIYCFKREVFGEKFTFENKKPVELFDYSIKGYIRRFFKRLFCNHNHIEFVRNIYGDEINYISVFYTYRSQWKCKKCGETIYKSELVEF